MRNSSASTRPHARLVSRLWPEARLRARQKQGLHPHACAGAQPPSRPASRETAQLSGVSPR